jgi:hypothetical protein
MYQTCTSGSVSAENKYESNNAVKKIAKTHLKIRVPHIRGHLRAFNINDADVLYLLNRLRIQWAHMNGESAHRQKVCCNEVKVKLSLCFN